MTHRPFFALWGWPIALAVLTATGLATALVSDTWGDWWSWVGLGVPVGVMGWYAWPRASARVGPSIDTATTIDRGTNSGTDTSTATAKAHPETPGAPPSPSPAQR